MFQKWVDKAESAIETVHPILEPVREAVLDFHQATLDRWAVRMGGSPV